MKNSHKAPKGFSQNCGKIHKNPHKIEKVVKFEENEEIIKIVKIVKNRKRN